MRYTDDPGAPNEDEPPHSNAAGPMQISYFQPKWRRWRWALWFAGTLFAILLENYWIVDEVYPYVGVRG